MNTFTRLRDTLRVISRSLIHPAGKSPSEIKCSDSYGGNAAVPFAAFEQFFPKKLCMRLDSGNAPGPYRIFLSSAYPFAAPFILFRLKRAGYSSCRVLVVDGGLQVSALR